MDGCMAKKRKLLTYLHVTKDTTAEELWEFLSHRKALLEDLGDTVFYVGEFVYSDCGNIWFECDGSRFDCLGMYLVNDPDSIHRLSVLTEKEFNDKYDLNLF